MKVYIESVDVDNDEGMLDTDMRLGYFGLDIQTGFSETEQIIGSRQSNRRMISKDIVGQQVLAYICFHQAS